MVVVSSPLGTTLGYSIAGAMLSIRYKNEFDDIVPLCHWNEPFYGIFLLSIMAYLYICSVPDTILDIDDV